MIIVGAVPLLIAIPNCLILGQRLLLSRRDIDSESISLAGTGDPSEVAPCGSATDRGMGQEARPDRDLPGSP